MDLNITKDSEKVILYLYKIYLERCKNGMTKSNARCFDSNFYENESKLSKLKDDDIYQCLCELNEHNYIKMDILDNIEITNSTIVYMENRFKNGFIELSDFLTKFIP